MKSDEELVASYRDCGQREALAELTERHLGKVRAMIYPMVLDRASTDDLTQEVFLRAFRGLAGFNGRVQFSTWLYRVAMNTVHSFLDRRRRSPVAYPRPKCRSVSSPRSHGRSRPSCKPSWKRSSSCRSVGCRRSCVRRSC